MWLSPRLIPSTTSSWTSTRTTFLPASAKTWARGMPTYPAPTMATSRFIARKAIGAEARLHYAPLRVEVRPGLRPGHDDFDAIAFLTASRGWPRRAKPAAAATERDLTDARLRIRLGAVSSAGRAGDS